MCRLKLHRFSTILITALFLAGNNLAARDIPADGPADQAVEIGRNGDGSVARYLEAIREQEIQSGAMDPRLGELLLGLGQQYRDRGEYEAAAEALDRALQIKRTSAGIQDLGQVPVLEALIDTNLELGNWDAVDGNYQLLLWVHENNLETGDPRMLAIYNRVGDWKLMVLERGLLRESREQTLDGLTEMYESVVTRLEEQYGDSDLKLVDPLKHLAQVGYHYIEFTMNRSIDEFDMAGNRMHTVIRCISRPRMLPFIKSFVMVESCSASMENNPDYFINSQSKKSRELSGQMLKIGKVLRRVVDIQASNGNASAFDVASSLADLGDWYLLNGRRRAARDSYQYAYKILESSADGSTGIRELFGQPVTIPVLTLTRVDNLETPDLQEPEEYVKLSFDVDSNGLVRNIDVVEEHSGDVPGAIKFAKQHLKSSLFRPRVENGEVVSTSNMELLLAGEYLERDSDKGIGSYATSDRNAIKRGFNSAISRP